MKVKEGIYTPLGTDGYELCHPVDAGDFERINLEVNGIPRKSQWLPLPVQLVHTDEGRALVRSDSPWLESHALIFRQSAIEALADMLCEYGELLPLTCEEENLWIYNPAQLLDALDEASSSVLRFDNGKIIMIERYAFRSDIIRDIAIFKIPNLRVSPVFVSHRFVESWKSAHLKGIEFKHVWAPIE